MPKFKNYELFLHYKQGDDFNHLLQNHNGDASQALRAWAASFKKNAAVCERLAKAFENKNLDTHADTHMICFTSNDEIAESCLSVMADEQLLTVRDDEDLDGEGEGED